MKWIAHHKGLSVAIAAIVLVLAMAVASFFTTGRTSPLSSAINTIFSPLHSLIGTASDRLESIWGLTEKYERLLAENEHLRVLYSEMLDENRQAKDALEENDRLRSLLGLELRERGFEFASATVVNHYLTGYERSLYLSKGTEAGIAVGQCVLSADGYLVGVIAQCGTAWSRVDTVIDTNASLGVTIERTGLNGVAQGDWSLMNRGRLKLGLLPLDEDIRIGDLVLTSGLGDVYPPDIPVGVIVEWQTEGTGMTAYAAISPHADLAALPQVFVVLSYQAVE